MPVSMYPSDFVSMDIFLDKFLSIFNGSTLTLIDNTHRFVGNVFPKSNIHILWPREYIVAVHSVGDRADNLHSFGVIDLSTPSLVMLEYSDSSVEWSSYELSACWWEIDVSNCSNMVFVYSFSLIHPSQVKSVAIWVIIPNCKVNRFKRVECHTCAFVG